MTAIHARALEKAQKLMENKDAKKRIPGDMKCCHAAFRQTLCSIDMHNAPISRLSLREIKKARPLSVRKTAAAIKPSKREEDKDVIHPVVCSVLQLSDDRKEACAEGRRRRELRAESAWTLLTNWHADCARREKNELREKKRLVKANQRALLNEQMQSKIEENHRAEMDAREERRIIDAAVEKDQKRGRALAEKRRTKNEQTKQSILEEMEKSLQQKRNTKEAARAAEKRELERLAEELSKEKQKEVEKQKRRAAELAKYHRENTLRSEEKKNEVKNASLRDARLMQEMLALLEKRERERESSLLEFRARIEARAQAAGGAIVEEAKKRQEKEDERLRKFQEAVDVRCREKALAQSEKKAEEQLRFVECLDSQMRELKETRQREREAARQYSVQVEEGLRQQDRKIAEATDKRRRRNARYQTDLLEQIREQRTRMVCSGIDMNHAERQLNKTLVDQARIPLPTGQQS